MNLYKELLSEIGIDAENYQDYTEGCILNDTNYLSIYDIAHKCKEWALEQGHLVVVYVYAVEVYDYQTRIKKITRQDIGAEQKPFDVNLEIKACEWILEQKAKS